MSCLCYWRQYDLKLFHVTWQYYWINYDYDSLNPYVKAAEYFLFINITIKMWFFFSIPCFRYWEIKIEGVCSMVRYFISFFFNLQVFSHTMIRTFFLLILPLIAFTYGMFFRDIFYLFLDIQTTDRSTW